MSRVGSGLFTSVACIAALATAGCSLLGIRPTPDPVLGCRSSARRILPVVDVVGAGGSAGLFLLSGFAAGLASGTNGCDNNPALCHHSSELGSVWLLIPGAFIASAVYGVIANGQCEEALPPAVPLPAPASGTTFGAVARPNSGNAAMTEGKQNYGPTQRNCSIAVTDAQTLIADAQSVMTLVGCAVRESEDLPERDGVLRLR